MKSKTLENLSSYDSSLVRVLLPVLVDDLGPVSDETAQKFGKMLINMVRAAKEPVSGSLLEQLGDFWQDLDVPQILRGMVPY